MKKSNRANVLLMELMAAVLLFALSATVMIRIYAQAYEKSAHAGVMDDALCEAQNLAERLYAAGGTEGMQALLSGEGFAQEDGLWRREAERFALEVLLSQEKTGAGVLSEAEVRAESGGEALFALPLARYTGGEAER